MINENAVATVGLSIPTDDQMIQKYHLSSSGIATTQIKNELDEGKSFSLFQFVLDREITLEEWIDLVTIVKTKISGATVRQVTSLPNSPYSDNICDWYISMIIDKITEELITSDVEDVEDFTIKKSSRIFIKEKFINYDNNFGMVVLIVNDELNQSNIDSTIIDLIDHLNEININCTYNDFGVCEINDEIILTIKSHPRQEITDGNSNLV